jgi:hypothetical protein
LGAKAGWFAGQAVMPALLESVFMVGGGAILAASMLGVPFILGPPLFVILAGFQLGWHLLHGRTAFSSEKLGISGLTAALLYTLYFVDPTGLFSIFATLISLALPHVIMNHGAKYAAEKWAGALGGLLSAGASGNVTAHVSLDWHYITLSGLVDAVREFGGSAMDKDGKVYTNVYVSGRMPENAGEWGLRNTGIKVNGKAVWASTREGALVLFADGEEPAVIAENIYDTVTARGGIDGGRRLAGRLGELLKTVNVDAEGMGFRPGIRIDHTAVGKEIRYDSEGNMVVSADMFKDGEGAYDKGMISRRLGELMTIRDAESVAMPQNMFIELDDVKTLDEFKENLEAFNKAGNGQMIVDPIIFKEIKDAERDVKIKELIQLAKRSGVRIYVDLTKDNTLSWQGRYRRLGFEGYVVTVNGETRIYNYVFKAEVMAERIGGYKDAAELKDKISNSATANKILELSKLKGLLKGGERSLIDRIALTEILKTTVLNFYNANSLNERYVRNVAYAWERNQLPGLPGDAVGLVEAIVKGNAESVVVAMGIGEVSHGVKTYLMKLDNEVKDEKRRELLKKAFVAAIVERMVAKSRLEGAGKVNGLADENLEKILGQALLKQKMESMEKEGVLITADKFTAGYENKPAIELYIGLRVKIEELAEDPSPKAINTIIELIPPLGEPKIIRDNRNDKKQFNAKSVEAVLGAA